MSDTRIYVVSTKGQSRNPRLVEATSAAQAVRHVVYCDYEVKAATTKALATIMAAGVQVEIAGNGTLENPHATTAP